MLSQTQSLGQAQPGGLNPCCAGCPPAHAKQGCDVGDVGPVLAVTARPFWSTALAGGGASLGLTEVGNSREGPEPGLWMGRCCTLCKPAASGPQARALPWTVPPVVAAWRSMNRGTHLPVHWPRWLSLACPVSFLAVAAACSRLGVCRGG